MEYVLTQNLFPNLYLPSIVNCTNQNFTDCSCERLINTTRKQIPVIDENLKKKKLCDSDLTMNEVHSVYNHSV